MTPHYHSSPPRTTRRAFSLLEALLAVMILAIVAAIVSPVCNSVTDVYVASLRVRRASERVGFAAERCVRFIREIGPKADSSGVAIQALTAQSLTLSSGAAITVRDDQLLLTDTTGVSSVLCSSLQTFTLTPLASDGTTSTLATPGATRRINIAIKAGDFELRTAATIRSGVSL